MYLRVRQCSHWALQKGRPDGQYRKTNIMTYQPGVIFTGVSEEAFIWSSTVEGDTYRERLRTDCGVKLMAMSMKAHHRLLHGTETEINWD